MANLDPESDENLDSDYLYWYQKFHFKEGASDKIRAAQALRMQLLFNNLQSKKYNDIGASHFFLERDLRNYTAAIDDQKGLNNYAEYVNALCQKSTKIPLHCSKWSSSVKDLDSLGNIIKDCDLDTNFEEEKKITEYTIRKVIASLEKINAGDAAVQFPRKHAVISSSNEKSCQISQEPNNQYKLTQTSSHSGSEFLPSRSCLSNNDSRNLKNCNEVVGVNTRKSGATSDSNSENKTAFNGFATARTVLHNKQKNPGKQSHMNISDPVKKSLGGRTRPVNSKFVLPIQAITNEEKEEDPISCVDDRLKGLDQKMIETIENEIMDRGKRVTWDDISGLEFPKKIIQEIVVWPMLRPDIFTGLRRPPKGILLFGPPGTGKTLIGKCIASQSSSTFFSISASSLISKWLGESEKLVRTLFAVARCREPAVIFIDEIDSMLSQRNENEHESTRRVKTEFLVHLDGATTNEDDKILVIGATNRPQELDEAARRRLVKRLYIPLPESDARKDIVRRLMSTEKNNLSENDFQEIAQFTDGYSGADMTHLCKEAALGPVRSIDLQLIGSIESQEVRPICLGDFQSALTIVRPSVSTSDLDQYLEWDKKYGARGTC